MSSVEAYKHWQRLKSCIAVTCIAVVLWQPRVLAAFTDVPVTSPYFRAVHFLENTGVIQGYSERAYGPTRPATRAELIKILVKARFDDLQIDQCQRTLNPDMRFSDVADHHWYAPFVCIAMTHGLVSGYPDGRLQPERPVIFAEAAKMIATFYPYEGVEQYGREPWFKPYVKALEKQYAIPLTIQRFDSVITRGEVAEMLYRLSAPDQADGLPKLSLSFESLEEKTTRPSVEDGLKQELARALENPTNVYTLQLNGTLFLGTGLRELPPDIGRFTNLGSLELVLNEFTRLPPEIDITNLTALNLGENHLASLPPEFFKLRKLKWLNLSGNPLRELPKQIGLLRDLEVLYVGNCGLTRLPNEIARLTKLREILLTGNDISPEELSKIRSLVPNAQIRF